MYSNRFSQGGKEGRAGGTGNWGDELAIVAVSVNADEGCNDSAIS